jgi:hypothetical protein
MTLPVSNLPRDTYQQHRYPRPRGFSVGRELPSFNACALKPAVAGSGGP